MRACVVHAAAAATAASLKKTSTNGKVGADEKLGPNSVSVLLR